MNEHPASQQTLPMEIPLMESDVWQYLPPPDFPTPAEVDEMARLDRIRKRTGGPIPHEL